MIEGAPATSLEVNVSGKEHPIVSELVASLISDFAPAKETVTMDLGRGRTLVFRLLTDEVAHDELLAEARDWIKMQQGLVAKDALMGPWKEMGTDNASTLSKVFILSRLAISGGLSEIDLLTLARKARPVFTAIWDTVMKGAYRRPTDLEVFNAEKKGSKRTPGTSSAARSPSAIGARSGTSSRRKSNAPS